MLGFDAARAAARPGGFAFFLQAIENFLHVASPTIMRQIASLVRPRQTRHPVPVSRGTIVEFSTLRARTR
jgi:hypothetical protein